MPPGCVSVPLLMKATKYEPLNVAPWWLGNSASAVVATAFPAGSRLPPADVTRAPKTSQLPFRKSP